ncbi:MAG: tetraacyldisaccharide 4'-kinase [Crocinitomicaceae bacterium]
MKKLKFFLAPFAIVYWLLTSFRNFLFDKKIKRSLAFSLPIINVGNLSMGGTGKTPHIELLIRLFKESHSVSTLSRGYGRKVFGFQLADESSNADKIGDEPFQFYRKFGTEISVAVDADRVNGVSEICLQKPGVNLILLDDAFQHRYIKPGFNILLTDFNEPFFDDFLVPLGTLRESRKGKERADAIIVTKCPPNLTTGMKSEILIKIAPNSNQSVFFSSIKYGQIRSLTNFNNLSQNQESIILVTGIARAEPLLAHLSKTYNVIKHFKYPDHYRFMQNDLAEINNLLTKFANDSPVIITTEKDAMRLLNDEFSAVITSHPWYYQEIEVKLNDQINFNKLIKNYVQKNSRDY